MRALLVLALVAAAADARADATCTVQSGAPNGITYSICTDSAIPATLYLAKVDLTNSAIELFATTQEQRGKTTSAYASAVGAALAINGDAFGVADFTPRGLAIGDSVQWSNTADDTTSAVFFLLRLGERTQAGVVPPEDITTVADLPPGTEGAVSGRPLLVRSGQVVSNFDCNDPVAIACERAPRSAVGVSADGNTMWLAAVDGWQQSSAGMTAAELAAFMKGRGADMAMALDGGSSSTLVLSGAVVNHPSDGVERAVANQIGVRSGTLAPGEMLGDVCLNTVAPCDTKISGAKVTLDDGRSQTTDTTGTFDFNGITPRYACITVRKSGYLTKKQCRQVPSNGQIYNSVALVSGTDGPPDAGTPDAPGAQQDAATPGGDGGGGAGGDAGNPEQGPGGGCCDAGGDRPDLALVVVVAWFLTRRRVTLA